MTLAVFKIVAFLSAFLFAQIVLLPWAIASNIVPLWLAIGLISLILVIWISVIEWMVIKCQNILGGR